MQKLQKHFGLISFIGFSVVALIISFVNWHGPTLTVSKHVGLNTESMIAFGIVCTVATILLAFCLLQYIRKKWDLNVIYVVMASVIVAGFFVTGWLPYSGPESPITAVHQFASWTMIYTMIVFTVYLVIKLWKKMNLATRIAGVTFLVYILIIFLLKTFFEPIYADGVFFYEVAYVGLFYVFVLALNYQKDK